MQVNIFSNFYDLSHFCNTGIMLKITKDDNDIGEFEDHKKQIEGLGKFGGAK